MSEVIFQVPRRTIWAHDFYEITEKVPLDECVFLSNFFEKVLPQILQLHDWFFNLIDYS